MKFPPARHILHAEPLTDEERTRLVDQYLEQQRRRREELFVQFVEECRHDPRFLDKALKELKPLRKAGRTTRPTYLTESLINALKGCRPGEIVKAIAQHEHISEPQARRLYDAARKRSR